MKSMIEEFFGKRTTKKDIIRAIEYNLSLFDNEINEEELKLIYQILEEE